MASFTLAPLQQTQLQLPPFSHCKHSSTLNPFKFHVSSDALSFPPSKHTPQVQIQVQARVDVRADAKLSKDTAEEFSANDINTDFSLGFPSFTDKNNSNSRKILDQNLAAENEPIRSRVILKDRNAKKGLNSGRRKEVGLRESSTRLRFNGKNSVNNSEKTNTLAYGGRDKRFMKSLDNKVEVEQRKRRVKKPKVDTPGTTLRVGLDICSRRGDVVGAIKLYDLAKKEGIRLGQYDFAVLLYLCSSAATGIVLPAKSGRSTRSLSPADSGENGEKAESNHSGSKFSGKDSKDELVTENSDISELNLNGDVAGGHLNSKVVFVNGSLEGSSQTLEGFVQWMKKNSNFSMTKDGRGEGYGIQVSDDMKRVALEKGFEIYNEMLLRSVPINEAIFTSVARMAAASGNGDMAFDVVKQMKEHGINPRLRSYGPALAAFCNNGDVEKAFTVEKHMLEQGIRPEEPELEALLRVSVEAGKGDNVYYVLHKLRTSVRQVSNATANSIESWFKSKLASRVGKRKWDEEMIIRAVQNGGGGWHGKGWLGKGKWTVGRTNVGSDGVCKCCGERLVTIDLDPVETENFAKSVASIAAKRERNSSFQKFQEWLDYYGPFEAVVDAANIGLYSQRKFKPSKVNAVVNGIRQMLPSRKWPLIILHNRRITGEKMDEPVNRALIEKWKNADALYATPTGSNDDWYWLYAAIKFRCLLVTNDEMRDHLFQLLGNDFFPKWKERHQVRFSFTETSPVFRMPPPCSVVIQESERGHWHIPIASEVDNEDERTWLCCTRASSSLGLQDSAQVQKESPLSHEKKRDTRVSALAKHQVKSELAGHGNHDKREQELEVSKSRNGSSVAVLENHHSILQELEAAERFGNCVIDFQI